jgi:hypothetical protein
MMVTFTREQSQLEVELLSCVINKSQTDGSHTNRHESSGPFSKEFQGPLTLDLAVHGSVCDWCNQNGEQQLTAISFYHMSGAFCQPCGQQFLEWIVIQSN